MCKSEESHNDETLSELVNERVSKTPTEHILNVFKAALSTAPFCGGIASLITDYIPSAKETRLNEFTKLVAADIEKLQGEISEKSFLTEEFAFAFEKCFRGSAENYRAEKLQAYRGILVNTVLR